MNRIASGQILRRESYQKKHSFKPQDHKPIKGKRVEMKGNSGKRVVLSVRLSQSEVDFLKAEATKRELGDVSSLVRELIMASFVLPTPSTLILETVLQLQFGIFEIAKKAAEGKPLSSLRLQSLQESLEMSGETLATKYINRRTNKIKASVTA